MVRPEVLALDQRYVLPTYARLPLEVVAGDGAELVGPRGERYLDFVTGLSVNNFGHCHPKVVAAIREQTGRLIHCSNLFLTAPQAQVAERLSALVGGGRVFFANSGAEANECALKIARKRSTLSGAGDVTGDVLFVEHSFHGRTIATLSATGGPAKQAAFGLPLPHHRLVPRNDVHALEEAFAAGPVSAFIAEPVQGESGVWPLAQEFLATAESLCRRHDALLIMDEVQSGLGRCGSAFAYQRYGLCPDIVTVAKSLAGGLPMGACIARGQAEDVLTAGDHGSTFAAGPVVSAAALAVLDLLAEDGLFERVRALGARLESWLRGLEDAGKVVDIRRLGLMVGADLADPVAKEVVAAGIEQGILLNATSDVTLRFLPSFVVTEEQIDRVGEFLGRYLGV